MDYEKKYKEALERARQFSEKPYLEDSKGIVDYIFPELKESEDERIRKELIGFLRNIPNSNYTCEEMALWLEKQGEHAKFINGIQVGDKVTRNEDGVLVNLSQLNRVAKKDEKQGEQNPADNVEPKFKVGDYIIDVQGIETNKIVGYEDDSYLIRTSCSQFYLPMKLTEKNYRLWSIADAKDGDVLVTKDAIFIFKHIDKTGLSLCKSYCEVIGNSELGLGFDFSINGVYPATKEQRDTLIKAMTEAGYTFDFEKKELKKIEPKIAAWTPMDEQRVENLLAIIEGHGYPEEVAWLNSLKDRVQPKQEWSEEDEKMRAAVLQLITDSEKENGWNCVYCNDKEIYFSDIIAWFKSLRPQSQWKPSLSQLNALGIVAKGNPPDDIEEIKSLYNDLHKLIN